MDKKLIGAFAVAGVIAAPAFADADNGYPPATAQSHVAANVRHGAHRHFSFHGAPASRLSDFSSTYYPAPAVRGSEAAPGALTRAEVRTELARAVAAHEIPAVQGG